MLGFTKGRTGAGTAGILYPLMFPLLINKFGPTKTVRGYAITLLVGMVPALFFVKPRLPESRVHGPHPRARNTRGWLRDKNFWFFITINTVQGFGYFVPLTWLPSEWPTCCQENFDVLSRLHNSLRFFNWSQQHQRLAFDRTIQYLRLCVVLHRRLHVRQI